MWLLALLATASFFATSCQKDDPEVKDYSGIDEDLIKKYLADHNITTARRQASGLYFLPVQTNAAAVQVKAGATVSVLYTGHLLDAAGTVFDASSQHNNVPLTFTVGSGQIISGFDEGIALMHIGDKAELLIPSALAYGNRVVGNIPANSVLRFEVEVVDNAVVEDNLIKKYLTDNNITTAQKQASGLYYLPVLANPGGTPAATGKTVSVLYTGHLMDATGTVFDASSQHNNTPIQFVIGSGQVILGFDAGIALMRKGEKAQLIIPSALAYGARGVPPTIPANSVLRFEVELVDVQ
ncbi:FKBP-type peptidyl-prolyl cis-trans isomerase [Hymenobacter sp. BT523]|uniref:FKBP-type peptidyl-prolyl cis-trans isomerase n=1 Tax=Hymenobacter sp. BT523 TaxID=2795725 RepID=UPI0018ED31B6|nr:FKBP-type peptidyl-prolyl cis-trans isomerase [Hymenobacter sp. BT523]MBJ6109170.1 FKBP-type peptidyl-prolyl cis-trans isomerase [Hymenobacter sp. BT523]